MVLKVLHLVGSPTDEFFADLSRLYAADCLAATADPERYDFHVAYITPDGCWRFPARLDHEAIAAAEALGVAEAIDHLIRLDVDVAVPQMFCAPGMTHYRSLLDVLCIPYLGNGSEAMALTMNKARARAVVSAAGVDVPAGEVLRVGDEPTIEPPSVVKPVDADNSVGVALVRATDDYPAAFAAALEHAAEVLVERFVEPGREVRCGIIERDGDLVCLPLEEYDVDADTKPIRSYEDKLARGEDGDLELQAKDGLRAWVDVEDPITERVWAAARACHRALGCRHYGLFDFRIDPDGRPWFLEAGLYCSYARQSVIATMAAAAGIDTPELFSIGLHEVLG